MKVYLLPTLTILCILPEVLTQSISTTKRKMPTKLTSEERQKDLGKYQSFEV